jgi:uncharacterized protein
LPTLEQAREWYQKADPVHNFEHIERVYRMALKLAKNEGADLQIVGAAALLHDVEGSNPTGETRGEHQLYSATFARRVLLEEGWQEERIAAVQHCIRAHRYRDQREPPATLEAQVLFDADKLDALGAVGVARVVAHAALLGAPLYAEPSAEFLQTGREQPGEAHSTYHEFLFKLRKIKERLYTSSARIIAEERDQYLAEYYQRLGRETRGDC